MQKRDFYVQDTDQLWNTTDNTAFGFVDRLYLRKFLFHSTLANKCHYSSKKKKKKWMQKEHNYFFKK